MSATAIEFPTAPASRRIASLAVAALVCTLVVVAVSAMLRRAGDPVAGIVLSSGHVHLLRLLHRIAATAELALSVSLAWSAWRVRRERPDLAAGAIGALAITGLLSMIGIAGGQRPGIPVAFGNLLGGLVLATLFAWMASVARREAVSWPRMRKGALLAFQVAGGALLAVAWRASDGPMVVHLAHLMLGVWISLGLLAWCRRRARGGALAIAALLVPAFGALALLMPDRGLWALLHGAAVAALLAATAIAIARA